MRMPWGKYRDYNIEDIPSSYLIWLIESANCDDIGILHESKDILAERLGLSEIKSDKPYLNPQIKKIYRQMCHKYHPDHGGSNEQMRAIYDFYTKLNEG